jgi:ribonucleoside-diphosphate reductase alpha chain
MGAKEDSEDFSTVLDAKATESTSTSRSSDLRREVSPTQRDTFIRPQVLSGTTEKLAMPCGTFYITINNDGDLPMEVFCRRGKSGTCEQVLLEALGRLVSLALRNYVPADQVAKQLRNLRCQSPAFNDKGQCHSCADAISKLLIPCESPKTEVHP